MCYQMLVRNLRRRAVLLLTLSVFVYSSGLLTPSISHAQTISSQEQYRQVLLTLIDALMAQIAVLQSGQGEPSVQDQTSETESERSPSERPRTMVNGAPVLARYQLTGESDTKQIPNLDHRRYLEQVYEIFPDKYDTKLREFVVFKDMDDEFGAFVETIPPEHAAWSLAVNAAEFDEDNADAKAFLIVHELAHIVSYEEMPGVPPPDTALCHTYFVERGCPRQSAYITAFVDEFWSRTDLERAMLFSTQRSPIDAAYEYYERAEDEYVSGYAALSPEEDFAESFAQYMVDRGVRKNSIASEKVWWFEQFAELQTIRRRVR